MSNASLFAKAVIQELVNIGRLDVLANPAYVHLLDKAHIAATTTSEATEHEMLARLLADRAQRSDKPTWAAIDRAVEVIPMMDASALCGMTVMNAALSWAAGQANVEPALQMFDRIFEQLLVDELPTGSEWLDHLESLNCVRMTGMGTGGFIPWIDYFAAQHPGYSCIGVPVEQFEEYMRRLTLPPFMTPAVLIPHDLLEGRVRSLFAHPVRVPELMTLFNGHPLLGKHVEEVIARESVFSSASDEGKAALDKKVDNFPHLARAREFWNEIPESFVLTAVGKVIARAFARHLDKAALLPTTDPG